MLSRVAERVYWGARYLERVENTARLVNVYASLLLDIPVGAGRGWRQLVDIAGGEASSPPKHARGNADELATLRLLLTSIKNPGSLLSSLNAARENFRTTRDVVPTEAWRGVNELYLFCNEHLKHAVSRRRRHEVLSSVVSRSQQITGLMAGTMSHGDAYQFLRIGRGLERADMSTRIIDVAAATLLHEDPAVQLAENTLWMGVLRSLSAYQMYRQYVRRRVNAGDVIEFLLKDEHFPRTVFYCLNEISSSIRTLPNSDAPLRRGTRSVRNLKRAAVKDLLAPELHEYIDELQLELSNLHDQIAKTWFAPR